VTRRQYTCVPGIGEKVALDLLKMYETLDGVYENLALLKESTRKKLEAGKDLAYLSKQLAKIWTDAPITLNLHEVDGSTCQPEKVLEMLQKLEFRSLSALARSNAGGYQQSPGRECCYPLKHGRIPL